jgi:hypothetical protein
MDHDIEKLLKTTIQTKIIEAFNDTPEMIEKMIQAAFEKPVDEYGHKPERFGAKGIPWIEWLVGEEIRRATKEAVREYLQEHGQTVKNKVRQSIATADFATPLADTVSKIISEDHRWHINLEIGDWRR